MGGGPPSLRVNDYSRRILCSGYEECCVWEAKFQTRQFRRPNGLGLPASWTPPNIQPPNIPVGLPWQLPERRSSPWRKKRALPPDRKSTRLNSSHLGISYAVFCLKKKTTPFLAIDGIYASAH